MVALSVVAIALVAIYRMHSQTLFMDTRSRFDTVATMLARQKLADIATAELSDITSDDGDFGDDHPGYAWRIQSEAVSSEQFREDGPVLKRIQVTISFDGDKSQFNLTTYRYLYE
jgi:general secretion pathway protein I